MHKASALIGDNGWSCDWINTVPGSLTYVRPKVTLGARIVEVCEMIIEECCDKMWHLPPVITCPHDRGAWANPPCKCYGCELRLCGTCYDAFIEEMNLRNDTLVTN